LKEAVITSDEPKQSRVHDNVYVIALKFKE